MPDEAPTPYECACARVACLHACERAHVWVLTCAHVRAHACVHCARVCACVTAHVCDRARVGVHVCVSVHVCMCGCVHVCGCARERTHIYVHN